MAKIEAKCPHCGKPITIEIKDRYHIEEAVDHSGQR